LFDAVASGSKHRRRSLDHERAFFALGGFTLRPGAGAAGDEARVATWWTAASEPLAFPAEKRGWQQLLIGLRRIAAGLDEAKQTELRDRYDAFVAPREAELKKPKGVKLQGEEELLELMQRYPRPMVVDADALTMLGQSGMRLNGARGPRLLTPHPGELRRLLPEAAELPRLLAATRCAEAHGQTVLLKGARTLIATPGRLPCWNTTGNPGMSTGGMGDLLTGITATLLGQGMPPRQAAALGAWVHGRAAELAISRNRESERSLTPTAVGAALGLAWNALETNWV
jgi:hydroxyethylthiazole kinase-like uncharacterized protein yjeF